MSDENKTPPKRPPKRPQKSVALKADEAKVVSEKKVNAESQSSSSKKTASSRQKGNQDTKTPARQRPKTEVKKQHGGVGRKRPTTAGRKKTLSEKIAQARDLVKKRFYVEFNPELFCEILDGLMTVNQEKNRFYTLAEILSRDGMPSRFSFYRWLDADESGELLNAYHAVSLACVDDMADEMVRVSYDAQLDAYVDPKTGMWDWHKLSVPRSKLIADNLKWIMERKAPAKWSNRVSIDVTSDVSEESLAILADIGNQARALAEQKAEQHAREMLLNEEDK